MKNFSTLLLLCLALSVQSQSFDFIQSSDDAYLHLSGAVDDGQNAAGSSFLTLHRTNDSEAALFRWNLGAARDLYGLSSLIADQDYWHMGVNGTDHFRISKYKYRNSISNGIVRDTTHALVILDDYAGTDAITKPRVLFPSGVIEVGAGVQLRNLGDNNLGLSEGNFLPAEQCGTNNLGSSYYTREWQNVVAESLVESSCRIPPYAATASFKSNTSGLQEIMAINTVKYSSQKSNEPGKLLIDPYQLIKIVPEAVHTHESIIDKNGNKIYAKVPNYGLKYTQLIPVLINAIQEQQEIIDTLIEETKALKAKIE